MSHWTIDEACWIFLLLVIYDVKNAKITKHLINKTENLVTSSNHVIRDGQQ